MDKNVSKARQAQKPNSYLRKEGVEALKAFVEQGGVVVGLNDACKFLFNALLYPEMN